MPRGYIHHEPGRRLSVPRGILFSGDDLADLAPDQRLDPVCVDPVQREPPMRYNLIINRGETCVSAAAFECEK